MKPEAIQAELFRLQDPAYGAFQRKLLPTVAAERIIGVRTPALRALAKELYRSGEGEAFLEALPHAYFDEDQLHAFLISQERDFARCAARVEAFLPWIDNWATCDQLSPPVFRRHREALLPHIEGWLGSERVYTLRFALGMLMQHFLDEAFDPRYPALVAGLRSEEYYVRMAVAWYFATALAKQYEAVLPYLEQGRLEPWTHNKAIQKSLESFRVSPAHKEYLRSLRRKSP